MTGLQKVLLAILGAAALALAAALLLPLKDWSFELEQALEHMGLWRALLIYCAVSVIGTLLLLPAWIFPLVAGAAFGLGWGLLAALLSTLAAAVLAFLAARHVLRSPVERAAKRSRRFKAVDRAVAREAWKIVALVRMSPVLPSGLKSYFFGITRIRIGDYASASLAGMFPGIALKVYVGSAGRLALADGGPLNWTLFGGGLVALVILGLVITRIAVRTLDL
jgi:uncharacterized membrane protein YdjX (TVP38/TMEM64 family)